MKNLFDWLNAHNVFACMCVLLAFTLPLLIVHILFKWESGYNWIEAEWSAGEVLAYIAAFISALSAVALGLLALWQNQKFKEESNQKEKLFQTVELEKLRLNNLPRFSTHQASSDEVIDYNLTSSNDIILSGVAYANGAKLHVFDLSPSKMEWLPPQSYKYNVIEIGSSFFAITNCGKESAHSIRLSITTDSMPHICKETFSVLKDEEIIFHLDAPKNLDRFKEVSLVICFEVCFQNVYKQKFPLTLSADKMVIQSEQSVEVSLIHKSSCMNFEINT